MNERDDEIAKLIYGTQATYQEMQFAALIRADERETIFNIVQKIAARFYKDATEEAFDELTDAILLRENT